MPEYPKTFNRLQKEAMLAGQDSAMRSAAAMERLCVLLEAYLEHVGADVPVAPEVAAPAEAGAPTPFNPMTESAPGVPLPGQENQ